jgi:hypothetical protein
MQKSNLTHLYRTFGQLLRLAREEQDLSQEEMGRSYSRRLRKRSIGKYPRPARNGAVSRQLSESRMP